MGNDNNNNNNNRQTRNQSTSNEQATTSEPITRQRRILPIFVADNIAERKKKGRKCIATGLSSNAGMQPQHRDPPVNGEGQKHNPWSANCNNRSNCRCQTSTLQS
jgi:hypothetical protein